MKKTITFLFLSALLVACEKDKPVTPPIEIGTLNVEFVPTMNGNPLQLNELFVGPDNKRMSLDLVKFYLSDFEIYQNGTLANASEINLIDFENSKTSFDIPLLVGTYDKLKYKLGVKKSLNGTDNPAFDASIYSNTHPLSAYNNMYWSWATGYIFTKLEGRIDTSATQDQPANYTFFYHCGLDTLLTPGELDNVDFTITSGNTTTLKLTFEFNDIFRTLDVNNRINMIDEPFTHTTDNYQVANQVMVNLKNAIKVKN
jgi:hypothetical protein